MKTAIDSAIDTALASIDTRPGEFTIEDVAVLVKRGLMLTWDPNSFLSPRWRKQGLGHFMSRALYQKVGHALRKRKDERGWRFYLCYRVDGVRRRQWLRVDNLTLKTLDAVLSDRGALIDQIGNLRPVLERARVLLGNSGSDATFSTVKQALWDDMNLPRQATGTDS